MDRFATAFVRACEWLLAFAAGCVALAVAFPVAVMLRWATRGSIPAMPALDLESFVPEPAPPAVPPAVDYRSHK